MDENREPVAGPRRAVLLDASDTDPRTRTGRERLGPPHPVLPVLGGAVLPDGHHVTVSYGTPDPDDPAIGRDPTGSAATEIESRVFIQTRRGRWLTTGAGRYRGLHGTVINGRGAMSSTQARAWCWLHPRSVVEVQLHVCIDSSTSDAPDHEVLAAELLVDDPARNARLFAHIVDDPAVHIIEATAHDQHGALLESIDWRAHDADWHQGRTQIGTVVPPGTPATRPGPAATADHRSRLSASRSREDGRDAVEQRCRAGGLGP